MRRVLLLCFTAVFIIVLFIGCSAIKEDNDISDLSLPSPSRSIAYSTKRTITPSLYFLDSSYTKLGVETRELTLSEGDKEEEVIAEALLAGPNDSLLRSLGSGLSLDYIEMSGEIANVYILADRTYDTQRKFIICSAVTNTIADYFGTAYITVFINGEALEINGYPCTVFRKSSSLNVVDLFNEYTARYTPESYIDSEEHDINVILYFPDETCSYILPEARTISVVFSEDTAEFRKQLALRLLTELSIGPKNNAGLCSYVSQNAADAEHVEIIHDETLKKLSLSFTAAPFIKNDNIEYTESFNPVHTAALYYTLSGALGNTVRVDVKHFGKSGSFSRALTKVYMGSSIILYMPKADNSSLTALSRTVYADSASDPSTYITELFRGPLETDGDTIKNPFSDKMTDKMFSSVEVKNGTAYVDMTSEFAKAASKMNTEDERMMFYSIINTLCGINRIKSVQFTIDGEFSGDNMGGAIHIEYPLLPNQGLLG